MPSVLEGVGVFEWARYPCTFVRQNSEVGPKFVFILHNIFETAFESWCKGADLYFIYSGRGADQAEHHAPM